MERLCDVVGKDRYKVNNKHDDKYNPLPPSKIVQLAEKLVGCELCYHLICKNCEHFVNELPSPSAGDLRELPGVPLRGEGSCGGGGAPRARPMSYPARAEVPGL